jgi:ketosteroid isomerase-like protein
MEMPVLYVLCCLLAFAIPASASDVKQEAEKVASAFTESFNKQDSVGVAAVFADDAIAINPLGPRKDIAALYSGLFKAGFNHSEVTVGEAWPFGEGAIAIGEYVNTGKKPSGEAIEIKGRWSATYVREGGVLKIKMISAFTKVTTPKD